MVLAQAERGWSDAKPEGRGGVVRLGEADRRRIRKWAETDYPGEACGLLIGKRVGDEVWIRSAREAPNLENERASDRYELDPRAFLDADREAREAGLDVVGFWHSHPDAEPVPSETDLDAAWPGYAYLIICVEGGKAGRIRAWSLIDGSFEERVMR